MSVSTRSPLRVAGAVTNSGNVNTGEQNFTLGGAQNMTLHSGIIDPGLSGALTAMYSPAGKATASGADILIYSGAGRLKDVLVPAFLISGVKVTFYDANLVVSGGPFAASGHRILGVIPTNIGTGNSGTAPVGLLAFDMPFNSGLCVNQTSGSYPFSVTFTPETNPSIG